MKNPKYNYLNKLMNPLDVVNNVEDIQNEQQLPDARLHQIVSFIKSGIRILGYGALWWSLDIAVILLILSEVVGIGEELV
jgi:hypothetical protein|tara:strand:+ start:243 stop:482 length:240 start_codon:yes stop_codon:yes gene_type:complete